MANTVRTAPRRWRQTWIRTWTSLHWRTTWPEYLVSIGLLVAIASVSRFIPVSFHLATLAQSTTVTHSAPHRPWGWILSLGILGTLAIPWLTGRFYTSVVYSFTAASPSLPWSWPWQDPVRHRRYWARGATWILGFFLYWLSWVAGIIALAVFAGRWGAALGVLAWALSLPWLITWTGAIFIDQRQGWDLWRTSVTRTAWGFRLLAVWVTIVISILVLGGLAWTLHPTTGLGITLTAMALLIVEYLLERLFNAWYVATYWVCFVTLPASLERKR